MAAADGGRAPGRFELGMRVRKADGQQFLAAKFLRTPSRFLKIPLRRQERPPGLCCAGSRAALAAFGRLRHPGSRFARSRWAMQLLL